MLDLSMFQQALPKMPKAGKALLVIDLQEGLVDANGILPIKHSNALFNDVGQLVEGFRQRGFGKIVWILSEYEASRPVNIKGDASCEWLVLDDENNDLNHIAPLRPGRASASAVKARLSRMAKIPGLVDEIGFGNLEADPNSSTPEVVQKPPPVNEAFLTASEEERNVPHKGSSPGAKLVGNLEQIRRGQDLCITKSYYSAITPNCQLIHALRMGFIQDLYICGALTNTSVYATAMAAAQNGFNITIIEDCLGFRERERHGQALRSLDVATGCQFLTKSQVLAQINGTLMPGRRNPMPVSNKTGVDGDETEAGEIDFDNLEAGP